MNDRPTLIVIDAMSLVHRAFHAVPALWRFHAIHHSSIDMDWLAGSRLHIVDVIVTRAIVVLPLFALGFDQRAVAAYDEAYRRYRALYPRLKRFFAENAG